MGTINTLGVEIPKDLICPTCQNNSCLLYPEMFAKQHLQGADKKWYELVRKSLNDFLKLKLEEYMESIKYSHQNT